MYAIIKTGGKQYKVTPGEYLDVEKLEGKPGDKVDVEVLLVNDGKKVITGADAAKAKVVAEIIDQHKGDKVIVFKFKKRKGYKRTRGHRQLLTRIAITSINGEKGEVAKSATKNVEKQQPKKAKKVTKVEKKAAEKKDRKPLNNKPAAKTVAADKAADKAKADKAADEKKEKAADSKKPAEKADDKKSEKTEKSPAEKKSTGEDLSKMTVAQLKELAKEKGVTIPAKALKADIVELLKNA